jgi:hypothetical protein
VTNTSARSNGIGQEVVIRVSSTPKGYKIVQRDGRGLSDGYFAKSRKRYLYEGDYADAEEHAHEVAYEWAEEIDAETRVVELGVKV